MHQLDNTQYLPYLVAETQASLNIERGPLFAADLFNIYGSNQILFLAAHHLCVDMVSWRIILQDLEDFLVSGSLSTDKPFSFQSWCAIQANHLQKEQSIKLPFDVRPPNLSYWGMDGHPNTYNDAEQQSFEIDKRMTLLAFSDSNKAFQTEPIDLFLSAISHSFGRVFLGREIPTLFNEGHGRESWESNLDLSRTVGWFTTICPLQVPVQTGKSSKII